MELRRANYKQKSQFNAADVSRFARRSPSGEREGLATPIVRSSGRAAVERAVVIATRPSCSPSAFDPGMTRISVLMAMSNRI